MLYADREFQDTQGYIKRPNLKKKKKMLGRAVTSKWWNGELWEITSQ